MDVPWQKLNSDTLRALVEEFVSRDGTDYGEREVPLDEKVNQLQQQLQSEHLLLLYDADSEQWDLVPREQAEVLLNS